MLSIKSKPYHCTGNIFSILINYCSFQNIYILGNLEILKVIFSYYFINSNNKVLKLNKGTDRILSNFGVCPF